MEKVRFQICFKLPYLTEFRDKPLGDQIIEVPKKLLCGDPKKDFEIVLDLARKQLLQSAEIFAEELTKKEVLDPLRFSNHSKRKNTKPITFIKL